MSPDARSRSLPYAFPYEEFDLSGIRTYPLKSRASKARAEDFARPYQPGSGLTGLARLAAVDPGRPRLPRGGGCRAAAARTEGRGIVWGFGAHVIKTGLSPVLIDLMERGFVSALATNGAGVIHDFEIALSGATSEDVDASARGGPVRHGRRDRPAAERRHQRRRGGRSRPRPGGRPLPVRAASAARARVGGRVGVPARESR